MSRANTHTHCSTHDHNPPKLYEEHNTDSTTKNRLPWLGARNHLPATSRHFGSRPRVDWLWGPRACHHQILEAQLAPLLQRTQRRSPRYRSVDRSLRCVVRSRRFVSRRGVGKNISIFMVWGWDVDLEAPLHISEVNSTIAFLSLKSGIALFSSEMTLCRCASKSTSHPQVIFMALPRCPDLLIQNLMTEQLVRGVDWKYLLPSKTLVIFMKTIHLVFMKTIVHHPLPDWHLYLLDVASMGPGLDSINQVLWINTRGKGTV